MRGTAESNWHAAEGEYAVRTTNGSDYLTVLGRTMRMWLQADRAPTVPPRAPWLHRVVGSLNLRLVFTASEDGSPNFFACDLAAGNPAMSWQTYVDTYLMYDLGNGRTLASAAILGHDGSVWAQSPNFPAVKPEEITNVMNAFNDSSQLAQNGLYLGGSKYMVIQGEDGVVIRGKKGPAGVTIKKTNSALVIGLYDEPVTPGECNVVVERLADYLIGENY